jgi:predicted RND superfamily exporter protein
VRIVARVRETDPNLNRNQLLDELNAYLAEEFPADGSPPKGVDPEGFMPLRAESTGMFVLYANMLRSLIKSQIQTSVLAVVVIWVMLSLLFRNPFAGFLAIVPNALPIVFVLGAMGWFEIPLDMATVMIASVSLGIGVDCAIHYLFRYREEVAKDGDVEGAILRSHGSIGTSILYTSLTTVVGFGVLAFSNFRPNAYFGMLTGFAMVAALFAMLTVLPVLIRLTRPFGKAMREGAAKQSAQTAP